MKRVFIIFFLIFLVLIIFIQCKKREKGKYLGTFLFTEQDIHIVPYWGGESFILVDSLGDSIHYKIADSFNFDTSCYYNPDHNLDTESDLSYEDYYVMDYVEIFGQQCNLQFVLDFSSPFKGPIKKYLNIYIGIANHGEIRTFWGTCEFNNGNLFQYNDKLLYYDSLTLVGRKYYSTYSLSSHMPSLAGVTDSITKVFYSVGQGIVGFRTYTGHTWSLN